MSVVVESHPEYRSLFQKVINSPEDNTLRRNLANWLAENNDPKRADFIRLQLRLLELPPCAANRKGVGSTGTCCKRCDVDTQIFNLFVDEGRRLAVNGNPELSLKIQNDLSSVSIGQVTSHFERGFVSKIEIKCEVFLTCAFDIFTTHPITKVILKDRPPMELPGGSGKVQYCSDASPQNDSRFSPLPARLFARLAGGVAISNEARQYDSFQQAVEALSDACVGYGRDLADGLLNA